MRFRSFRSILDECLVGIQQGETVETCLARYPRHAERLKPLLSLAARVRRTPPAQPRPWAQATAWNAVRHRASELRSGRRRTAIHVSFGWLRPLAAVMALFMAIGVTGGATAFAAQDALPNDTLYGVKLFTEDVQVWITFDDTSKADMLLDQSDERMQEITTLISHGDLIPENVLTAIQDRNERALDILETHQDESTLWSRALLQAESQERVLLALWDHVEDGARVEYTQAVADIHNARVGGTGAAVAVLRPEDLAGGVTSVSGSIEEIEPGVWSVGGVRVRVDERTIGALGIEPGATAAFVVGRSANGRLYALSVSKITPSAPPSGAFVTGEVEEVTATGIRVAGQWIPMTPETLLKLPLRIGQTVEVTLGNNNNGVVASQVSGTDGTSTASHNATLTYEGNIEGAVDDNPDEWTIGGLTFTRTSSTRLDFTAGPAADGSRALVEATVSNGELLAQSITVLAAAAPVGQAYLVGSFEGTRSGLWIVSGLELAPKQSAQEPDAGSLVAIDATEDNGALTVRRSSVIQSPNDARLSRFVGTTISIQNTIWNMEIGQVRVASATSKVSGKTIEGARAIIWGRPGSDGVFQAVYVHMLDQTPVLQPAEPTPAPATP
jgi:hypothetical protein